MRFYNDRCLCLVNCLIVGGSIGFLSDCIDAVRKINRIDCSLQKGYESRLGEWGESFPTPYKCLIITCWATITNILRELKSEMDDWTLGSIDLEC